MPFLSIVTATLNAHKTLHNLLQGLADQTCRDFEILIQDSCSGDSTLKVASAFQTLVPGLSVVSEADTGIYDAWNKALLRARGEWVLFLGADDRLVDETVLEKARTYLDTLGPEVDFACMAIYRGNTLTAPYAVTPEIAFEKLHKKGRMPNVNEGIFYRRRIFSPQAFDTSFRIAGDFDFMARHLRQISQIAATDIPIVIVGQEGLSNSPEQYLKMHRENLAIVKKHLPKALGYKRHLRPILKGCVGKWRKKASLAFRSKGLHTK